MLDQVFANAIFISNSKLFILFDIYNTSLTKNFKIINFFNITSKVL